MIEGLAMRLKMSRISSSFSRKQIGELIGVSESMVGFYETGTRQPSLSVLIKLASHYKVTTDYLLGCETKNMQSLPLTGLTEEQIQALNLTVQCFRTHF